MFKKILLSLPFFGLRLIDEKDFQKSKKSLIKISELVREIGAGDEEIDSLYKENNKLRIEIESLKKEIVIDPFIGDPSPVDREQRKLYVASVASLHKEILEPKLKHMISILYKELSESTNKRDDDQAIKGAIYSLKEIIRWGDRMVNEQVAIQAEDITK